MTLQTYNIYSYFRCSCAITEIMCLDGGVHFLLQYNDYCYNNRLTNLNGYVKFQC